MRVFVTGATGFVGSAIVDELLAAGHRVLGLARTDASAEGLLLKGAEVHRGDLDDLESLKQGAVACDAVVHTAFNHDFSRYKASCEHDRRVIHAFGEALAGTPKPLLVTSGVGLLRYGRPVTEADLAPDSATIPRAASEEAARAVAAQGVNAYIVRLPPSVHGAGDKGFVPVLIGMAREKGRSAYIGEGDNAWPAVHRLDAAVLYRLILERQPEQRVYHTVAEEGIAFRRIAEHIAQGTGVPAVSLAADEVEAHFGWFAHFALMGCEASAGATRSVLGWEPAQPGLLDDLGVGGYFDE